MSGKVFSVTEYDAVIVGAGVLGLSTAYHIARTCPNDKILVVEQMGSSGQGNTAKSAAMFRTFFSTETGQILAETSIDFYKHIQEEFQVDLGMHWTGYLWLFVKKILTILGNRRKKWGVEF